MSTRVQSALVGGLDDLRHEPTAKRIRATLNGRTLVDSTAAVLVWEPRRVVPSYAVPIGDVAAELRPASSSRSSVDGLGVRLPAVSDRPVLDPSVPFAVHTAEGDPVDLHVGAEVRTGAGLLLGDPDLAGHVLLDFDAFDQWWEEDEPNVGHPRDPFHRVDALRSSRHVRLARDGVLLAESTRPTLLFETSLPVRIYLPREDVLVDLVPSATRSTCAYKGHASYLSPRVDGREVPDLVWTYEQPLKEAADVTGLVAFFDERVDVVLDGVPRPRPVTPWSD
jgi:uncharacterized protein (DUF427 family)